MHLVACITLLRESLSGMAKDSTKCLYGTVTAILEIAFSSNTMYLFDCLGYVYLVSSIDIYSNIITSKKYAYTAFSFGFTFINTVSVQIGKVSSSCENSSASRWKV